MSIWCTGGVQSHIITRWPPLTTNDHDWLWLNMIDYDWWWLTMTDSDWLWATMKACDYICGHVWLTMIMLSLVGINFYDWWVWLLYIYCVLNRKFLMSFVKVFLWNSLTSMVDKKTVAEFYNLINFINLSQNIVINKLPIQEVLFKW